AGPVASPYGVRSVYNGQPRGHHLGVDIRAAAGTPVRAAHTGVVVLAERLPLGGNTVIVDHGAGVFTSYLHLQSLAASVGARVRQGQVVGFVGSTGLSTAPHLHWAVRVNGVPVDPLQWVRVSW
ncbi:MAG: M23 family metallopeptidase, partial [bacterium]